jgi:hypothetical protein
MVTEAESISLLVIAPTPLVDDSGARTPVALDDSTTAAIAGGVVGALVMAIIIVIIGLFVGREYMRSRRQHKESGATYLSTVPVPTSPSASARYGSLPPRQSAAQQSARYASSVSSHSVVASHYGVLSHEEIGGSA